MRVSIRSVDGLLFRLILSDEVDIGTLRSIVCERHESPTKPAVDSVRLVHKGSLLDDDTVCIGQLDSNENAEEITLYLIVSTTAGDKEGCCSSGSCNKNSNITVSGAATTSENSNNAGNLKEGGDFGDKSGDDGVYYTPLVMDRGSEDAALQYIMSQNCSSNSTNMQEQISAISQSLSYLKKRSVSKRNEEETCIIDYSVKTVFSPGNSPNGLFRDLDFVNSLQQQFSSLGAASPTSPTTANNNNNSNNLIPASNNGPVNGGIAIAGGPDDENAANDNQPRINVHQGNQAVRWLDLRVIVRLGLAFFLFAQGNSYTQASIFAGFAVVYYLFETGIIGEVFRWIVARRANNNEQNQNLPINAGNDNANNNNNAANAPEPALAGGNVDQGDAQQGPPAERDVVQYLYDEGFPVPQEPGILLDLFSFVIAFFMSLVPGWDPRPVTPIRREE